jgi:formimidoylglutamate deiminase
LCPITESNLGDGIFDGKRYLDNNGNWGIGTDSNIRISLSEELKTFEYSQRLRDRRRVVYAKPDRSNGRALYDAAARGGAQALQRQSGQIAVGQQADLLALDANASSFIALQDDGWLDAWIFANDDSLVSDVWVAGKHLVSQGRHIDREPIELRYRNVMKELAQRL